MIKNIQLMSGGRVEEKQQRAKEHRRKSNLRYDMLNYKKPGSRSGVERRSGEDRRESE